MKKTNVNSSLKFNPSSYDGPGSYENTDEIGFKELMVVLPKNNIVWSFNESTYNELVEVIILEQGTQELKVSEEVNKENSVTEDFALKMMSIVVNKEKFNDLK